MESLPTDIMLKFNPDTLEAVRRDVGLDSPGRIEEAIDILEDWIKKQSHFAKKDFPREYLERTIVISKGLLERAKLKIEKLCTFRTLMPDFFAMINVDEFSVFNGVLTHAHLPKLTKENYRVYMFKLSDKDFDSSLILKYYRNIILVSEYLRKNDYCAGFQLIMDYRHANIMNFVTKVNPLELRQILTLITEGYGMRTKGIHLITTSKMVDALVLFFKQVLSPKLGSRIHVHKELDTLYEYVSPDVLPVEYGGSEISLKELNEKWLEVISSQEYKVYFEEMQKANTNESCRQTNNFNEEYAGIPGSFRALTVD